MKTKNFFATTFIATMFAMIFTTFAAAQTTVVVTPTNTNGWYSDDTRPGGAINYVVDSTAPGGGVGALQLTTNAATTAKAQYMHNTATPLADINELSYWAKQVSASFAGGDASYQLQVCLGGATPTSCTGFTTLVYEPYQNGVVVPNTWQFWDVDNGQFWSSRSYTDGMACTVIAGGGGAPFYTLAGLQAACPNAVAVKFGVNIGSNNPSYNVYADLVNFDGTTYDFEPYEVATNKDQCKSGGWTTFKRADGSSFKNQGDCIQYTNTGK